MTVLTFRDVSNFSSVNTAILILSKLGAPKEKLQESDKNEPS